MDQQYFNEKTYRFFFSQEESRLRAHVHCGNGGAKFWLESDIRLVKNYGLLAVPCCGIEQIIEAYHDELNSAWKAHFGG